MPKDKRQDALQRKGKSPSNDRPRTAPIEMTQAAVDGVRAGDRKVRKDLSRRLVATVPSHAPADAPVQEGPKLLPLTVNADEMKKIRKARRLPREIVARLLERKTIDAPRKNPIRKYEAPTRKRQG